MRVEIVRLDPELPMPSYAAAGDAGCDLRARHVVTIAPRGGRAFVATGIRLEMPRGHAGFIQPRSGLALQAGVTVLDSPGLVDPGFSNEVAVLLVNHGSSPYRVARGDRIAQLVIKEVAEVVLVEVVRLPDPAS